MEEDIANFIKDYLEDEIEIDTPKDEVLNFDTIEALIEYIQN